MPLELSYYSFLCISIHSILLLDIVLVSLESLLETDRLDQTELLHSKTELLEFASNSLYFFLPCVHTKRGNPF